MLNRISFILFFLIVAASGSAFAAEPGADGDLIEYGELFMEETSRPVPERFELGLLGGADIGNPYINGFIGELFARVRLSRFIQISVNQAWYTSERTLLGQAIEDELNLNGIISRFPVPESTTMGQINVTIFRGLLNFWGFAKINADLFSSLGAGFMKIERAEEGVFGLNWNFGMRLGFNKTVSGLLIIAQDINTDEKDRVYTRVSSGVSFSF